MYLINVQSMQLEYFQDDRNLVYAILSHRWRDDEVLFDDMRNGTGSSKAGWAKLSRFCQRAATGGYRYAWCDTCCIDKSSSADLSESINSMFRWYQNSAVAYAYLDDVAASQVDTSSDFKDSEWFTRGWCLQELLAPKSLIFYNQEWIMIGNRRGLSSEIRHVTNIPVQALTGQDLNSFSIGQKMSWASTRITTRVEDMAYSLMGLFGVNMPLLYGEGERAFLRLQEEIIRRSSDQSILVHESPNDEQGLLATSPADFCDSHNVVAGSTKTGEPYSLTNVGLSIELLLYPWAMEIYLACLECERWGAPVYIFLMLRPQVVRNDNTNATDQATRIKFGRRAWLDNATISHLPSVRKRLFIASGVSHEELHPRFYGFWIRTFKCTNPAAEEAHLWACTWGEMDNEKRLLKIPAGEFGTAGILMLQTPLVSIPLRLALTTDFCPVIEIDGDPNFLYADPRDASLFISVQGSNVFRNTMSRPNEPLQEMSIYVKRDILSNIAWTTDQQRESHGLGGMFVRALHRDRSIHFGPRKFGQGWLNYTCEKRLVGGSLIWTLDITFEWGEDGLERVTHDEPPHDPFTQGRKCCTCYRDEGPRFHRCLQCADYHICRKCLRTVENMHEPSHIFEETSRANIDSYR